jgi:hypothetical protein
MSAFAFAETYVFVKQSVEPLFCNLLTPRTWREATQAPLLPKVRGHFAEFLNRGSLDHLGIFLPAYQCRFAVRAEKDLARGFSWRPGLY